MTARLSKASRRLLLNQPAVHTTGLESVLGEMIYNS
jgi:hypothetical protein